MHITLPKTRKRKKYFDFNARTLITLWGDINGSTSALYDYPWREWSGLIKEYYYKRWEMFYDYALGCLKNHKLYDIQKRKRLCTKGKVYVISVWGKTWRV